MKKAIIIGSGVAGLAAALRIRAKGYEVTVFEANDYPGGKLHAFKNSGFHFDYGPSLFTMPQFVEELFELFGEKPSDHFQYYQKNTICNYFWEDGTTFSASSDKGRFIEEASIAFSESAENISDFLKNSAKKYDLTADLFLTRSLHKASTYLNKETIKGILGLRHLDLNKSLDQVNKSYFKNPKLVQLFNRYATYNGSNPYTTPGIMSLIPQLEMRFGTFYPKGGMHTISKSLYELAVSKGVEFRFNSMVGEVLIENNKAIGVQAGETFRADVVVSNMDVFSAYQKIIKKGKKPKKVLRQERSSSALIFYWGIDRTFEELDLHNIFFSSNYHQEFKTLFEDHTIYSDPTVYINITSKEESHQAPKGGENWFVMVNTPGNKGQDWDQLKREAKTNILKKVSGILQTSVEKHIVTEDILDPIQIENDTLSHEGSLYGTSSNTKFAAFLRHPNFSSSVKNLYFCGGSAHPGGGIPLCLLSAKIVSDLIPNETY